MSKNSTGHSKRRTFPSIQNKMPTAPLGSLLSTTLLFLFLTGCGNPLYGNQARENTDTISSTVVTAQENDSETAPAAGTVSDSKTASTVSSTGATTASQGSGSKTASAVSSTAATEAAAQGSGSIGSEEAAASIEPLIREYLSQTSLEDKVSGLFLLTPEALTGYGSVTEAGDVTKEALEEYPVAGLIYFPGSLQDRDQVRQLLENTARYGAVTLQQGGSDPVSLPPFLAVDEEGGDVSRVKNSPIDVPAVESMGAVGSTGDPEAAFEAGDTIGAYLHELGFNLDFAPVADVLIDPANQTIGSRSFGTDPALCGQMVHRFIDGLHKNGVGSCIKHFPGLGDTETDTHTGGAWSARSLEEYSEAEFLSFCGGLEAGTDLVMISHLTNETLTGSDLPASLNRTLITEILRQKLGYEGVVITDSLQMGAVTERFDSAETAVLALEAGADLLLMPMDFPSARQGILDAVRSGRITEARIDESLQRILLARYRASRSGRSGS